jgi:hypothetical protein
LPDDAFGTSINHPPPTGTYSLATGIREQAQCLECPSGFYCEGGANIFACADGSYSLATGLSARGDCPPCAAGHFCPNATAQLPCPDHTTSPAGAKDLQACACNAGYRCRIVKVVHCYVVLPINLTSWTASIQELYVSAIALAAGVSPSNVHVQTVQVVVTAPGAGRRLMNVIGHNAIEVHTSIHSSASTADLQANLNRHLSDAGLPSHRGIRVSIHSEVVGATRVGGWRPR